MAGQIFLGVLGIVVALILFSQWRLARMSRQLRGQPAPPQAKSHPQGVLYFFHSPRCAPCRSMVPVIDELIDEFPERVVSIDVSERPEVAAAFRVAATPTTVIVRDGQIAEVLLGVKTRRRLAGLMGD